MKRRYFTSTVITRHLIDTAVHKLLRRARSDAEDRRDPCGRSVRWVIARECITGPAEIIQASDALALEYATTFLPTAPRVRFVNDTQAEELTHA